MIYTICFFGNTVACAMFVVDYSIVRSHWTLAGVVFTGFMALWNLAGSMRGRWKRQGITWKTPTQYRRPRR